jgi:diguanylate cyclase (GGDEF)-like protein/PAS domain S-box-containing protein
LLASLDVQALTGFLVHFELGDGVAIIRHVDGAVVARHPGFPGTEDGAALTTVPPVAAEHGLTAVRWTMPGEPVERLYGHRGSEGYPFTVLVGRSMDEVLEGWRETALPSALVLLALMLAWLAVYALLLRAHRQQQQLSARLEAQSSVLLEAQRIAALGHWQLDLSSGRLQASDEALRMLGRGVRHLDGGAEALFALAQPDDRARLVTDLERAAGGARSIDTELRLQLPDGTARTLHLRGERQFEDARPLLAGTVQDVTAWVEARERLRQAERQYRFLFDRNPLPMWAFDRETLRFLAVNDAAVEHYGYSRAEFLERTILDIRPAEDVPEVLLSVRTGSPDDGRNYRHLRRDGSLIQVMLRSVDAEFGGRPARIVLCHDLTERLRAEQERCHNAQRFSVVAELTSDAIVDWKIPEDEASWSDGLRETFGHRPDQVRRIAEFEQLLHPDDHGWVMAEMARVLASDEDTMEWSYRLRRGDGSFAHVLGKGRLQRDATGRATRLIASIADVSRKRRDEAQLRMLQRAIEAADNGIVVAAVEDARLPLAYVNPAFERMGGACASTLAALDLADPAQAPALPPALAAMREAIASGNDGHALVRGMLDGSPFWHDLHVAAVRDGSGRITHHVGIVADVSERERSQAQLTHRATHDALTGLPNRVLVMQRIVAALEQRLADDSDVAVLFVDLDHFKLINDTLGHETGDRMLKVVAERLRQAVPDADTIGRMGGDEFVVVLREARGALAAERAAERILAALTRPLDGLDTLHYLTPSIGFARCGDDMVDADALLRRADMAMYEAKNRGRNGAVAFSMEFETAASERLHMVSSLREALERDEFILAFQPQFDAESGKPVGLEALIRWRHPERGLLPPGAFIGIAEESGLIIPIGRWVLHEAARHHRALREAGWGHLSIAVNVSADQFLRGELLADVEAAMALHGLPEGALELELTESVVLANPDAAIATMHALREQGVTLAIDDFGTGYSSLNYLRELPADRLKLDRAFVADLGRDPKAGKICVTIMRLAQSLGLKVVAEGVEEWDQFDWLRENGCDEVQGYRFAHPMAFHDVLGLLARGGIARPRAAVA